MSVENGKERDVIYKFPQTEMGILHILAPSLHSRARISELQVVIVGTRGVSPPSETFATSGLIRYSPILLRLENQIAGE